MSGIEILAVVLKTLPVLLTTANAIYPIFNSLKHWWSFEQEYEAFIGDIESIMMFYGQHLLIFLQPLELDLEENTSMHENPDSRLWYDLTIRAKIRRRIPDKDYAYFMKQMRIMHDALEQLVAIVRVDDRRPDTGTFDYELERLRISFSKAREDQLKKLQTANDRIGEYVRNESLIKRPISGKYIGFARTLQTYATTFREALQNELKCLSPTHVHNCAISACWTNLAGEADAPSLRLLLGSVGSWRQLTWKIVPYTESATETGSGMKKMTEQVSERATYLQVKAFRDNLADAADDHRVAVVAAAAAFSTAMHPAGERTATIWSRRRPAQLKKGKHRSSPFKGIKLPVRNRPQQQPTQNIEQASAGAPLATVTTEPPSVARVRFAASYQPPHSNESVAVTDICSFLNKASSQDTQRHLDFDRSRVLLQVAPSDQTKLQGMTIEELHKFTSSADMLPDRLRIGVQLVYTVLSFGYSGWMPEGWPEKHVSILRGAGPQGLTPTTPYLSHESLSTVLARPKPSDPVVYARAVLHSLGIALLELVSKTTLQQTPYWEQFSADNLKDLRSHLATSAWHAAIAKDQSDDLSDPIRRCLQAAFANRADLQDREFLKEVFEGVISPLENFIAGWRSAPPPL